MAHMFKEDGGRMTSIRLYSHIPLNVNVNVNVTFSFGYIVLPLHTIY